MEEEEKQVYIIPQNVNENGKVLAGFFRLRSLVEGLIVFGVYLMIWYFISLFIDNFIVKTILFMPGIILGLIVSFGIKDQSTIEYLLEWFFFKQKRRQMRFRLPRPQTETQKKKLIK